MNSTILKLVIIPSKSTDLFPAREFASDRSGGYGGQGGRRPIYEELNILIKEPEANRRAGLLTVGEADK